MALATFNSRMLKGSNQRIGRRETPAGWANRSRWPGARARLAAAMLLAVLLGQHAWPRDTADPGATARQAYLEAQREHTAHPQDANAAWRFARATFDLGDFATNNAERAELAQQGIAACKDALVRNTNCAPLHYYLGLNDGQLARTRTLGALRLVDQMEREFNTTIALDPDFDYAGAERTLGLLYRDAPAFASIGSKTKARAHLERALELAPRYPDNRLVLIESELKWGDRKSAREQLKLLEQAWPAAQAEFTGPAWAASWTDWTARLEKLRRTLEEPARLETPRH
jgi:tetratricopeptide (TPR) repeat protein